MNIYTYFNKLVLKRAVKFKQRDPHNDLSLKGAMIECHRIFVCDIGERNTKGYVHTTMQANWKISAQFENQALDVCNT